LRSNYSWCTEPVFDSNSILLDVSFAKRIGVSEGDSVVVQIQAFEGEINAYEYTVGGLFFGNSYSENSGAYMPLDEFQWLFMQDGDFINGLLIFFPDSKLNFDQLQSYVDTIKREFGSAISIQNRYQLEDRFMSSYYIYVCIFYTVMVFLINFSLLMVFSFSLYNHYYNEFCLRRKEFLTLFSFGLSPVLMKLYVLLDNCLVFLVSILPFAVLALVSKIICKRIVINSIKYSEFIALIGSNRIILDYNIVIVLITVLSIFLTSIISGFFGLKKYQAKGAYS
jgi:ABC-type antimicrobial peptide transport system permease subunit